MRNIAVELHCHTCHSDGRFTAHELAEAAKDYGLDTFALTDHNTHSGWQDLEEEGVSFIHGMEWTTFFGHMVALHTDRMVDWRNATIENIDEKILEVRNSGGIVGLAHPFNPGSPMCTGCYWDFNVRHWENVNYIEVWHGEYISSDLSENIRAKKLWLSLLDKGYRIAPANGRDWHALSVPVQPTGITYVGAENADEASVCEGIAAGRTLVSLGPDADWWIRKGDVILRAGDEYTPGEYTFHVNIDYDRRREVWDKYGIRIDEIRLLTKDAAILASVPGNGGSADIKLTDEPYIRMEAYGEACGKKCEILVSAPIYLKK